MKKEVINAFTEEEKELLNCNRWAIEHLAKIERIFINQCMQDYIPHFMLAYIDGLLEEDCIDKEDYFFLKELIDIVNASRIKFFVEDEKLDIPIWEAKSRRIHMEDYFEENDNIMPVKLYKQQLDKVYKKIMSFKY